MEEKQDVINEFWKSVNNAKAYLRAARYMTQESSWEAKHNIVRLAIEEIKAANDLIFDAELSEKENV